MTIRTARIRTDRNLGLAAEIVALSGVSDLMVVDDEDRFVGVLSEGDILRAALPNYDEVLESGGSLEQAFALFVRKGEQLRTRTIEPLIIREPLFIGPDEPVAKAAALMVHQQIRRLPVVEADRLLGTISRADVCRAVIGLL